MQGLQQDLPFGLRAGNGGGLVGKAGGVPRLAVTVAEVGGEDVAGGADEGLPLESATVTAVLKATFAVCAATWFACAVMAAVRSVRKTNSVFCLMPMAASWACSPSAMSSARVNRSWSPLGRMLDAIIYYGG